MPDDKKKEKKYADDLIDAANGARYLGNDKLAEDLTRRAQEELDKEAEEKKEKAS